MSSGYVFTSRVRNNFTRGNSIYSIVEGPNWTWKEAQSESLKLGGDLTTINNAEENQWLVDTFGFQNSIHTIKGYKEVIKSNQF